MGCPPHGRLAPLMPSTSLLGGVSLLNDQVTDLEGPQNLASWPLSATEVEEAAPSDREDLAPKVVFAPPGTDEAPRQRRATSLRRGPQPRRALSSVPARGFPGPARENPPNVPPVRARPGPVQPRCSFLHKATAQRRPKPTNPPPVARSGLVGPHRITPTRPGCQKNRAGAP